jgi:hypothetical protein
VGVGAALSRQARPRPQRLCRVCDRRSIFCNDADCGILRLGMSLILAVRDDRDIVMASDGRVLDEDLGVMSNNSLKTLALNAELCLGLAGPTDRMRPVLTSLGIKCRGAHPADLLGACQEVACPVDVDYRDVRDEVTNVLRWMTRRVPMRLRYTRIPAVILAGRSNDRPALCDWRHPAHVVETTGSAGYSEAIAGSLPEEGTREETEFRRMVRGERSTERAEERLTGAVRFCARYFGAGGPVNEAVFLRRLSRGFELVRVE